MATKKTSTADEKFTDVDFPLFAALEALDKKDYGWFDRLTEEQKKGFSSYMLLQWMSTVQGNEVIQRYYLQNTDYSANKNLFHENIIKHHKLQWLMLCTISPGIGKQYHKYIPHIKSKVSLLKEPAKLKDTQDYFKKVYPKADENLIKEVSQEYVRHQQRKMYFAEMFPNLKHEDIEILNEIITDEEIKQYEKDLVN